MTTQRILIVTVAVLMILAAFWLAMPKRQAPTTTVKSEAVSEVPTRVSPLSQVPMTAKTDSAPSLWMRPAAKVAARNARRVRFADLKRLGASDELINRLTDGDFSAVFQELKQQGQRGDAAAANI